MLVRLFVCPRLRERRVLPVLALGASLAMTVSAVAQGQAVQFARECALKEIPALTTIEDLEQDEVRLVCFAYTLHLVAVELAGRSIHCLLPQLVFRGT